MEIYTLCSPLSTQLVHALSLAPPLEFDIQQLLCGIAKEYCISEWKPSIAMVYLKKHKKETANTLLCQFLNTEKVSLDVIEK